MRYNYNINKNMLQRDYIMRLIQEFTAAISRFLSKDKDDQKFTDSLEDLYRQYLGPYDFYHISTMSQIMHDFVRYPEQDRLYRMEMLACLYEIEADRKPGPTRDELLSRSLTLFTFIDNHSDTFSIERRMKIDKITAQLEKNQKSL